jgi:hypothetical protein
MIILMDVVGMMMKFEIFNIPSHITYIATGNMMLLISQQPPQLPIKSALNSPCEDDIPHAHDIRHARA